jgi:hypothetical protein
MQSCAVNIFGDPDRPLTITDSRFEKIVPNRFRVQLHVGEDDNVPLSATRAANTIVEKAVRVGATTWL